MTSIRAGMTSGHATTRYPSFERARFVRLFQPALARLPLRSARLRPTARRPDGASQLLLAFGRCGVACLQRAAVLACKRGERVGRERFRHLEWPARGEHAATLASHMRPAPPRRVRTSCAGRRSQSTGRGRRTLTACRRRGRASPPAAPPRRRQTATCAQPRPSRAPPHGPTPPTLGRRRLPRIACRRC
eukprot:5459915-Prymnesium_polylepis.1